MDRAPQPWTPEEPETEEQLSRKRRFLKRLRGFGFPSEGEVNLTPPDNEESESLGEFWSRNNESTLEGADTGPEEIGGPFDRVQLLGRNVLEQSCAVHGFAESLSDRVEELPEASRTAIEPETDRLKEATGNLFEATEELDEELEGLADTSASTETASSGPASEFVAPTITEKVKPKEQPKSEIMGMARLVIATIMGGALGAIVGEGSKKEQGPSREKTVKADKIIEQRIKLDAQEAELQRLRATASEAGIPKKEHVKKVAELTEKQVEITHTTTEQVKVAAQQAAEAERTFQIPEQRVPGLDKLQAERLVDSGERVERLQADQGEKRENRDTQHKEAEAQPAWKPTAQSGATQPNVRTIDILDQRKQATAQPKAWVYGVLIAIAATTAVGLILSQLRIL